MRLLLDTHILIWWATDDPKLAEPCRLLLLDQENDVYFSSISIWEISIKFAKGTLNVSSDRLQRLCRLNGIKPLAFNDKHAVAAGSLPPHHHDPFDRALIAQAITEPMTLVSSDQWFRSYQVSLLIF